MPQGLNTYGDIGNATAGWYSRKLLSHAMPVIILERFGLTKPLPKKQTKVIEFRRSQPFQPKTIPLVEGVTPQGSDFGYDTISAQIQQYGDWVGITDVVQDTSKDDVLRDIVERQGEQAGETREALTWGIVRAGTNVQYGGAVASRTAVDQTALLSAAKQRSVVSALHRQKAKKFTSILSGSEDYETYPIEACYFGIVHTDMISTVRELTGGNQNNTFVPVSRYGSQMPVSPHEVGNFEEIRYVASPDLPPFVGKGAAIGAHTAAFRNDGANFDVYPALYLGREAFGCIPLRGKNAIKPMVLNPDVPRGGDPLAQRGTAAWKMYFACLVLNEAWMRRLEVACAQ